MGSTRAQPRDLRAAGATPRTGRPMKPSTSTAMGRLSTPPKPSDSATSRSDRVDSKLARRRGDGEIAVPLRDLLEGMAGIGGGARPFQCNDHLVRRRAVVSAPRKNSPAPHAPLGAAWIAGPRSRRSPPARAEFRRWDPHAPPTLPASRDCGSGNVRPMAAPSPAAARSRLTTSASQRITLHDCRHRSPRFPTSPRSLRARRCARYR